MLLGVDIGYSTTKLIGQYTELKFESIVGTGRERNYVSDKSGDIELEYQSQRYFIGDLAKRESWDATMAFDRNKVKHMNTKLLLLAALGQTAKGEDGLIYNDRLSQSINTGISTIFTRIPFNCKKSPNEPAPSKKPQRLSSLIKKIFSFLCVFAKWFCLRLRLRLLWLL